MAVLHDWAFVTAPVLAATSAACGTVPSASQPKINHLAHRAKEALSSQAAGCLFVLGHDNERAVLGVLLNLLLFTI